MSFDLFELGGRALGKWAGDRKTLRQTKAAQKQYMAYLEGLDRDPAMLSDSVTPYQKTNSPVARATLEAFMLGQDSDATYSGETNASFKKAAQDRTKANLYGTPTDLAAKGAAAQADNPYKIKPIRRSIGEFDDLVRTDGPPEMATVDKTRAINRQLVQALGGKYNDPGRANAVGVTQSMTDAATQRRITELIKKFGSAEQALYALREGRA